MNKIYILIFVLTGLMACEDQVNIPLDDAPPMLNVDAWLVQTSDTQNIRLNYSRPYFDNSMPEPINHATVKVVDMETGEVFDFSSSNENGVYSWIPPAGEVFGEVGHSYRLEITLQDGATFGAVSLMDSVPTVDSITFEYNQPQFGFDDEWYYAEFWAKDLPGLGNTYWIKTYKNHEFFDNPDQINIAYDAGGSAGAEVDSLPFIQPIRTAINDFGDGDEPIPPYTFGDTLRVEIHAISEDAWFFLSRVIDETSPQPSFAQLFANPLANSPTNIVPNNEDEQVVGFFSVAAFSSLEVVMSEELVVDRSPD